MIPRFDSRESAHMGIVRLAVIAVLPLALAACSVLDVFDDEPEAQAPAPAAEAPAASQPPLIPLRAPPETLLGLPPTDRKAPASKPATPPPAADAGAKPPANPDALGEDEAQSFYEGVLLTYAFDACGLPLIGETARQDIGRRIEACPNTDARKAELRTLYRRALAAAERDGEKLRASALAVCKDKRAFLSNVMAHSEQLRFDDSQPPDCGLLSPHP
jgi:hypothetical protein